MEVVGRFIRILITRGSDHSVTLVSLSRAYHERPAQVAHLGVMPEQSFATTADADLPIGSLPVVPLIADPLADSPGGRSAGVSRARQGLSATVTDQGVLETLKALCALPRRA
ncbi:MAG: hypothetical protein FWF28_09955 [Micrococcales bacterium]|nr:hypothetical protein [Micrococcales bacterium]